MKKQDFIYNLTLLTFMMFAMMQVDGYIRFLIVIILFALVKLKNELFSSNS